MKKFWVVLLYLTGVLFSLVAYVLIGLTAFTNFEIVNNFPCLIFICINAVLGGFILLFADDCRKELKDD